MAANIFEFEFEFEVGEGKQTFGKNIVLFYVNSCNVVN